MEGCVKSSRAGGLLFVLVGAAAGVAGAQGIAPPNAPAPSTQEAKAPAPATSPQNQGTPAPEQAGKFLRYVKAGAKGAKARNLYDDQGLVVLEIPAGAPLAVYGEKGAYLEVEAPGGFEVWVFGEYLEPGSDPALYRVKGENVNMRPRPSSGVESLPLAQKLGSGDRVRLIRRNDPAKPLAEDWVAVRTPPGTRAWVRADETVALEEGANGAALWAAAVLEAAKEPAPGAGRAGGAPADSEQALEALKKADEVLARERKKDEQGGIPNYAAAAEAYAEVLKISGEGAAAERASEGRKLAETRGEAYQLRRELEERRAAVAEATKEREEGMRKAAERDAFEGRFDARGWLERRQLAGETSPTWLLRWAGDRSAELVCHSGRYDLSIFAGYEIGINGREVRGAIEPSPGIVSRPRQLDVSRIEVIAGRR
jgi:hypothetical protein